VIVTTADPAGDVDDVADGEIVKLMQLGCDAGD
jgi:hypothetical protein